MVSKSRLIPLLLLAFLGLLVFASALPTGPTTLTIESDETSSGTSTGDMVNISGGYLAKLNLTATAQNRKWKALLGDVSGAFTLDDASGSTIYNWSSGTISGEVYATRQPGAITWGSITCADATQIGNEETALNQAGGTDDISSTFASTNTNPFIVAGQTLDAGTCSSTNTFVNNASQSTNFEEIIIHDGSNIVYATLIDTNVGYDGGTYDFQMLVPEDANEVNPIIPYYLYVELD